MKKIIFIITLLLSIGVVDVSASESEDNFSLNDDSTIVVYLSDDEYAEKQSDRTGLTKDEVLAELSITRQANVSLYGGMKGVQANGYNQIAELVKGYTVTFDTGGTLSATYYHTVTVNLYINPPYGATITNVIHQGVDVTSGSDGYSWSGSSYTINNWGSAYVNATARGKCYVDVPGGSVTWKSGVVVGSNEAYISKTFTSNMTV